MEVKDIVDIASKGVTTLATILAGGWAYYRFLKGRIFHPRLTLIVSAKRLNEGGTDYVLSRVELKNSGLSRISFEPASLRIGALTGVARTNAAALPRFAWLGTFGVLQAHAWIDSGETLTDEHLLILPAGQTSSPTMVIVRVVADNISFSATAIADRATVEAT
jgi:hypothetical protein